MIPAVFHRTVPSVTSSLVEAFWVGFQKKHPGWDFRTYREPIDPAEWPISGHLFAQCQNGAQKAGLIRLEALVTWGGFYVDSDVEPVNSFQPLLRCDAVAGWEDETTIPDAVMGSRPNHPVFIHALQKAMEVVERGGDAWHSGPGITTRYFRDQPTVLVLPPGAFYPHHYLRKNETNDNAGPWAFARHHWHGSWLNQEQKESIEGRQR